MKKMKRHFQFKLKSASRLHLTNEFDLVDVSQKQFFKQQDQLLKLKNHLRLFLNDVTHITNTIDNMYACFNDIYEPVWVGISEFNHISQESIKIWRQFIMDFKRNIARTIEEYDQDFPDMKRNIEKRNKKLVELKRHKEMYESYRNAKRIDEVKLNKAESDYKNCEKEFQNFNNDLHESLPSFCDKRIGVYIEFWTKLAEAEVALFNFLQEGNKSKIKILSELSAKKDSEEYSIKSQVSINSDGAIQLSTKEYTQSLMTLTDTGARMTKSSSFEYASYNDINDLSPVESPVTGPSTNQIRQNSYQVRSNHSPRTDDDAYTSFFIDPTDKLVTAKVKMSSNSKMNKPKISNGIPEFSNNTKRRPRTPPLLKRLDDSDVDNNNDHYDVCDEYEDDQYPYAVIKKVDKKIIPKSDNINSFANGNLNVASDVYDTISDTKMYYHVIAAYEYDARDSDELNLKKHDVILVLPWNSSEQMEYGWLYGENTSTKEKGLFPENFTKIMD